MGLFKLVDRELTQREKSTLAHFEYYTNGGGKFALVGENVIVIFEDDDSIQSVENATEAADKLMGYAITSMPDFTSAVMDDGCGIVIMHDSIYAICEKEDTKVEAENKLDFKIAVSLREDCLQACAKGEVIAVYLADKNA